jgi:hypothetical protein
MGCKDSDLTEQLHLQYCRMLLKVNKSTPKCMLYGELGRLPLNFNVELRLVNFWFKIVSGNKRKLSYNMYSLLYKLDKNGIFQTEWVTKVKHSLNKCGIYDKFWLNQEKEDLFQEISQDMLKNNVREKLREYYKQSWLDVMHNSSKCSIYKEFKFELKLEKYLIGLDSSLRLYLTKYRNWKT